MRAYDGYGTEVALPATPEIFGFGDFSVRRTGNNTFELSTADGYHSAVVEARVSGLPSGTALFYAARPVAGAVLVDDAKVMSPPAALDPNAPRGVGFRYRTTLAGVGTLTPGTILVGAGTQPIAGRVVSATANASVPADTDVVLELVPLTSVFKDIRVRANYDAQATSRMVTTSKVQGVRIASAERLRRMNVTGAACKGDAPALAALSGELEAKLDPQLSFRMDLLAANGTVYSAAAVATGTLNVSGKAVVNLGASVTGGVSCTATLGYLPIPVTGPLSPFFAPIIPLDAKFELGAQVNVNAFTFSAEFKQSATVDMGFNYYLYSLSPIQRLEVSDPELTRNVSFPTQASVRVKTTAFLGLSSGLALGGALARLEVIEATAGPEFEAKFGGTYDVATDSVYTSEYELKGKAALGPGEHVQLFFERLLGSSRAFDISTKVEKSIAKTASAREASVDKSDFKAGDELNFKVALDPASATFPLVGYNVTEVRIYRLNYEPTNSARLVATMPATNGQMIFNGKWTSDFNGSVEDSGGRPTFYAMVVDKPLSPISSIFPFELGRVRGKIVAPLSRLAGTGTAAYAINNGVLSAMGENNGGAIGANLPIGNAVASPVTVPLSNVRAIVGSAWHATALLADGSVYAWGWGGNISVIGGAATNNPAPLPVAVRNSTLPLTDVISISAGYSDTVAIKSDGSVVMFGASGPATTIAGGPIAAASMGRNHVLLLNSDGQVLAMGQNGSGQLGDGSYNTSTSPVVVPGMSNVVAVAAGSNFSLALKKDGTVWAWGNNINGQLGIGSASTEVLVPTQVNLVGVTAISADENHAMALADGVVYTWGVGDDGRLGNGCAGDARAPVVAMTNAIAIDAGEFQSMAVTRDGTVMQWGRLLGVVTQRCTPAPLGMSVQ